MKKLYNAITYPLLVIISNLLFRINNRLRIWDSTLNGKTISKLFDFSRTDSAEYFKDFMAKIMLFEKREDFWDFTLTKVKNEGVILEFGVFNGNSINYMSGKLKDSMFYGFDSFEGLQEDWLGNYMPKGFFDLKGKMPKVNQNVKLIKGWFNKTLPLYIKSEKNNIKLLHIDCDTYESTKEVFSILGDKLNKGTIIIFDDYHGYPGWRNGEHKAFKEFLENRNLKFNYLAITNNQASVELI